MISMNFFHIILLSSLKLRLNCNDALYLLTHSLRTIPVIISNVFRLLHMQKIANALIEKIQQSYIIDIFVEALLFANILRRHK